MIDFDKVSLYFNIKEGTRNIFNNVSFFIDEGVYFLRGENGTGKSTLFKLLHKDLEPTEGRIDINDSRVFINNLSKRYNNYKVSTYFKILCYNRNITPSSSFIEKTKATFNIFSCWNKRIKNLRSNEKALVSLIDLVFQDYDIILLDEVFANVDENIANQVFHFIVCYYKNKTIICIDHSLKIKYKNSGLLKIANNNIILEKNYIKNDVEEHSSIVSSIKSVNRLKSTIINNFISFTNHLTYLLLSIFVLLLPILSFSFNTPKKDSTSFRPLVTITNYNEPSPNKKHMHFKVDEADSNLTSLINYITSDNGGFQAFTYIDKTLSFNEIKYFGGNEYFDVPTISLTVQVKSVYDLSSFVLTSSHYKIPELKVKKYEYIEDSRSLFISKELYDLFFSAKNFFNIISLVDMTLNDEFNKTYPLPIISFYHSEEKNIITNIKGLNELEFYNQVDDIKTKENCIYDPEIVGVPSLSNIYTKTILFSSGYIFDYLSKRNYSTYYFDSVTEYKNLIKKANKDNMIISSYDDYYKSYVKTYNQNIFINSLYYLILDSFLVYSLLSEKKRLNKLNYLIIFSTSLFESILFLALKYIVAFSISLVIPLTILLIAVFERIMKERKKENVKV